MVDDVLAMTRCTEIRLQLLPARVVVYLLLAGCLFAELGWFRASNTQRRQLSPYGRAGSDCSDA